MVNPEGATKLDALVDSRDEADCTADEQIPLVTVVDPNSAEAADESTVTKANVEFQCLSKAQLQEFVNNPFWKRTRLIVFILFWVVWVAMLAAVIIIIALSPKCPPRPARQFWQKPFYRLQVKSFAPASDADPTAAGSIEGLAKKMDYLVLTLGFKNFILDSLVATHTKTRCPVDFKTVNSSYGKLDTLKALTKLGRKKGFSFLMEFDASQADIDWKRPDDGADVFLSASGTLASRDGGSALSDDRLHLPKNSCPSLNVTSPTVLKRVEEALTFWLDAGMSGFVLTNVAFMSPAMREAPALLSADRWFDVDPTPLLFSNDSVRFVQSVRHFLNAQAEKRGSEIALFVDPGNTGFPQPEERLAAYLNPATRAHAIVSTVLGTPLSPLARKELRPPARVIQDTLKAVGDSGSVLFPTAWPSLRRSSESFWAALSLVLPGVPCLYYGQELGMGHVSGARFLESGLTSYLTGNESTDASESPMQWSDSTANAGWLDNATTSLTWFNLEPRSSDVERRNLRRLSSAGHPTSELQLVQALVNLVNTKESLQWGSLTFLPTGGRQSDNVIAFKRVALRFPPVVVIANAANKSTTLYMISDGLLKGTMGTLKVLHSSEAGTQAASSYEVGKEYSLERVFVPAKSVIVFLCKEGD